MRLKADRPTVLDTGGVLIEVAGHGIGNGELENVRHALEKVPPHRLRGLQRVEFVDHELRHPRMGRLANALYVIWLRVWPTTIEETQDARGRLLDTVEDGELVGALVIIDRLRIRIRPPS